MSFKSSRESSLINYVTVHGNSELKVVNYEDNIGALRFFNNSKLNAVGNMDELVNEYIFVSDTLTKLIVCNCDPNMQHLQFYCRVVKNKVGKEAQDLMAQHN